MIGANATPLIAWSSLAQVLVISALFTLGIVVVLSISLRLFSLASTKSGGARSASLIGGITGCVLVVAAVVFGVAAIATN